MGSIGGGSLSPRNSIRIQFSCQRFTSREASWIAIRTSQPVDSQLTSDCCAYPFGRSRGRKMNHGFPSRVAAEDPDKEATEEEEEEEVQLLVVEREQEKEKQGEENASSEIVWENPQAPPRVDDYIIRHGTRLVRPYYFEFVAHVKRRWIGMLLVDIYAHEFKGRDREYYLLAIENGRILVDGRRVHPSFRVRDSQKLSHFVHRHEPPVRAEPALRVLDEGPDVITVCKPPSMPVHACGQYRKNTVVGILEAERRTGPLFPIHRLDRLVSGLLILARNARTANEFREEIEGGRVHKQYVAKVRGVFPAHAIEVHAPLVYDPRDGVSRVVEVDEESSHRSSSTMGIEKVKLVDRKSDLCELPVVEVNATVVYHAGREGVSGLGEVDVAESGSKMEMNKSSVKKNNGEHESEKEKEKEKFGSKVACTKFQRLSSDGVCSIVRCEPLTGRTHQIRVHLRHLGHPIANDALYSQPELRKRSTEGVWGAKSEASEAELVREAGKGLEGRDVLSSGGVLKAFKMENLMGASRRGKVVNAGEGEIKPGDSGEDVIDVSKANVLCPPAELLPQAVGMGSNSVNCTERVPFSVDPFCTHCPRLEPSWYRGDEEGLWLHCVRYASTAWAYECPLPDWAL